MQSNEPTIKASSLQALFDGCELSTKPKILLALHQLFNLDYKALPAYYSFERYVKMLDWLRRELYPSDDEALGYEKLGRHITQGVFQRPAGQVLKMTVSIIGSKRALPYFFRKLGTALPFANLEILEERIGYVRFILHNVIGPADVTRGMMLESMKVTNVSEGKVTYRMLNVKDTEFEASWQDN